MDVYNNNIWLVETIARAATDNHWPRVDVKAGNVGPGVNGGFQGTVKSPMNKGRGYKIPGLGLAGDWPGGWTQTYAQIDTEAGPHGFDEDYFVQQVAGLSQIAGEFMHGQAARHRSRLGRTEVGARQAHAERLRCAAERRGRHAGRSSISTSPSSGRLKPPRTAMRGPC